MTAKYTPADKSLWDDSDLLRLYDEQLELDKEHGWSKRVGSTNPNSGALEVDSNGSTESSFEDSKLTPPCDASAALKHSGDAPHPGPPLPQPDTKEGLEDVLPLLKAYYDAGYAAGVYVAAQRKRCRCEE